MSGLSPGRPVDLDFFAMGMCKREKYRKALHAATPLQLPSAVLFALLLSACGTHSHEGKPIPGPNVAIAQSYLDSISHPDEAIRAYGCRIGSPVPILFYVILFPGTKRQGLLLIYAPPFNLIPRAQAASFEPTTRAWRLRELPNTDWSFHHLTALQLVKQGSDNRAIEATFNKIMAAAPVFSVLTNVKVAPLLYTPEARPWLVNTCP